MRQLLLSILLGSFFVGTLWAHQHKVCLDGVLLGCKDETALCSDNTFGGWLAEHGEAVEVSLDTVGCPQPIPPPPPVPPPPRPTGKGKGQKVTGEPRGCLLFQDVQSHDGMCRYKSGVIYCPDGSIWDRENNCCSGAADWLPKSTTTIVITNIDNRSGDCILELREPGKSTLDWPTAVIPPAAKDRKTFGEMGLFDGYVIARCTFKAVGASIRTSEGTESQREAMECK